MKSFSRSFFGARASRPAPHYATGRRNYATGRRNYATGRRNGKRGGQVMAETALAMTFILLPLTLGILQFGIILNASQTLTNLAREGGRYAAVRYTDEEIRDYIVEAARGTNIKETELRPPGALDSRILIGMVPPTPGGAIPARVAGNPIQVRIVYPMANKFFIGNFLKEALSLKRDYIAESTFVLE